MKNKLRNRMMILAAVIGLIVSAIPAMGEAKAADAYTVKVEKGYLALRSKPAYDASNELESLYTGDTFYVMSDYDDTYVYGYSESGKMGYVNKNYLEESYNIASGLYIRESDGVSFLETDDFTLRLPGDISWAYEVIDSDTISIYHTQARVDGYGGHVVSIKAYDWGVNDYEEFPSWSVAGLNEEKKFIAIFPTDVQVNPEDSVQTREYNRLMDAVNRIDCEDEELAKENPFTVLNKSAK